jgi:hypothetical protein
LITGLLLIWASFQAYESLASLLDQLVPDGSLEAFQPSLYQVVRIPLALAGTGLVILAGFVLVRWEQSKGYLQDLPAQIRNFFALLDRDMRSFFEDARHALKQLGHAGIAVLAGLMLSALIFRLANLDLPLGHDEAYTYNAFASRPVWFILSDYHMPNNHVLLSLLIHGSTHLFGNQVWAIRLPTILSGVLMVPATFWFAKRTYSLETAFLGATMVSVFPALIKYSVIARGYTIICLMTLLVLALGDYVRVKENRFAWVLIGLFSALGFFTIPIMLFPFGGLYLWLLLSLAVGDIRSYESRSVFLKYWIFSGLSAAILTILLYLPILISDPGRFFENRFVAPLDWSIFLETLNSRLRNTWLDWTESLPFWLILLGTVGNLCALFWHKKISNHKFPMQFAFAVWITVVLLARRPDMFPRLWLFLAAPLLVWSAAGLVEPLRRIPWRIGKAWNVAQLPLSIIFAIVAAQSLMTVPSLPAQWSKKDALEQITIDLKDYIHQDDLVTASMANLPALRYYFNHYDIPRGTIRQSGKFQRAIIIVDQENDETLASISPKAGFDFPIINIDTARVLIQVEDLIVYEGYPAP